MCSSSSSSAIVVVADGVVVVEDAILVHVDVIGFALVSSCLFVVNCGTGNEIHIARFSNVSEMAGRGENRLCGA